MPQSVDDAIDALGVTTVEPTLPSHGFIGGMDLPQSRKIVPPKPSIDDTIKAMGLSVVSAPQSVDDAMREMGLSVVKQPPAEARGFTDPNSVKVNHGPETTTLSPTDETSFQAWVKANRTAPGVGHYDSPDSKYDMRGFWNDKEALSKWTPGDHFPDTYKQHGHPLFSNQSKYSTGPNDGGYWVGDTLVPPSTQARPGVYTPFMGEPDTPAQPDPLGIGQALKSVYAALPVLTRAGAAPGSGDKVMTAGRDILGAGFRALTPMLVWTGIEAPLETAALLLAAHKGAQVGSTVTKMAGGSEVAQGFVGDLAAVVAGGIAGHALAGAGGAEPTVSVSAADAAARKSAAKVLGIDPNASPEDIQSAWKAAARQNHPDVGGSVEAMQNVNTARDWLLDHPATGKPAPSIGDWIQRQTDWLKSKFTPAPESKAPATPAPYQQGAPEERLLGGDIAPVDVPEVAAQAAAIHQAVETEPPDLHAGDTAVEPAAPPVTPAPVVAPFTIAKVEPLTEAPAAHAAVPPAGQKPFEISHVERAEENPEEHTYSSTQVNLPAQTAKLMADLAAKVPDEDLAENGRETDFHVTVKYGLHTNDVEKVKEVLANEPPITVTLGKTSYFPNSESGHGDVVKVDVDSEDLHRLNAKIADALDVTDTHPDYVPHATLFYAKAGKGKDYEGDTTLEGHTVTLNTLTFSAKDGTVYDIPLTGKGQAVQPPPVAEKPLPPKEVLRRALPDLGFTLSDDHATIWNNLRADARRVLSRQPTNGEMRAVVQSWIDWAGTKQTGTRAQSIKRTKAALAAHKAATIQGVSDEAPVPQVPAVALEGQQPSGRGAEQRPADQGGVGQAPRDVSRHAPGGLRGPAEYEEVWSREPAAANSARLTPEVRRELERIHAELDNFPFEPATWDWSPQEQRGKTGNAAGGNANIIAGHAGAPVYQDIQAFAPVNLNPKTGKPAKEVGGTRRQVQAAVSRVLATGDIHNNLAEGAVRVAEHRAADDWKDLSPPSLPHADAVVAPDGFAESVEQGVDAELAGEHEEGDASFDVNEFREDQARLPEAGAVREQEVATPKEDAPYALEREAAQTKAVEPDLFGHEKPEFSEARDPDTKETASEYFARMRKRSNDWTQELSAAYARDGIVRFRSTAGEELVHPSTAEPGKIQVTHFDKDHDPTGHWVASTIEEVAKETIGGQIIGSEEPQFSQTQPIFYSALTRAAENIPQAKGSAEQMQAMLMKAKGVKAEELQWSGVVPWLREQAGQTVTKQQIVDYLRANELQVSETVLGDEEPADPAVEARFRKAEQAVIIQAGIEEISQPLEYARDVAEGRLSEGQTKYLSDEMRPLAGELRQAYVDRTWEAPKRPAKYMQHTLPGGDNYRELLITLPPRSTEDSQALVQQEAEIARKMAEEGLSHEEFVRLGEQRAAIKARQRQLNATDFRGGHFDVPNVIAHIRFKDRVSFDVVEPKGGKAGADSLAGQAKLLADVVERPAFISKGLSGLNVEDRKAVQASVLGAVRDDQIRRDVIESVPVDVVDDLARLELTPKKLLNDETMLSNSLSVDPDASVRLSVAAQRGLVGTVARFTAKRVEVSPDLAGVTVHGAATPSAGNQHGGYRTLFIEEVQSDLHQKGRREGYKKAIDPETKAAADRHRADAERAFAEARVAIKPLGDLGFDSAGDALRQIAHGARNTNPRFALDAYDWTDAPEAREAVLNYLNAERLDQVAQEALRRSGTGVPDAPFKTTWPELAMKRAVRYAAEHGYDKLAWTTGEQQNERYDLSKQVDSVSWMDWPAAGKDMGILTAHKDGEQVIKETISKDKLPDYIGKDAAEKLLAEPPYHMTGGRELKGDDLKVGGKGMQGFYDKILPSYMSKFGKPFGATVGTTRIRTNHSLTVEVMPAVVGEKATYYLNDPITGSAWRDSSTGEPTFASRAEAEAYLKNMGASGGVAVHAVAITPAMRASVLDGLPLFQRQAELMTALGGGHPEILKQARAQARELKAAYDAIPTYPVNGTEVPVYDTGKRLKPGELRALMNNEGFQGVAGAVLDVANAFADKVLTPAERQQIERIGILLDSHAHGVFFPDPLSRAEGNRKATILLNQFETKKRGKATPGGMARQAVVTILHELAHVNQTGHGPDFKKAYIQYSRAVGNDARRAAKERIEKAYADPERPGELRPDLVRALQVYTESRGRRGVAGDALGRAGGYERRPTDEARGPGGHAADAGRDREGTPAGVEAVSEGGRRVFRASASSEESDMRSVDEAVTGLKAAAAEIHATLAAPTVSEAAKLSSRYLRWRIAQMLHTVSYANNALKTYRNIVEGMSVAHDEILDIADALEGVRGARPIPDVLKPWIPIRNEIFNYLKKQIADLGIEKEWKSYYLGHVWETEFKEGSTLSQQVLARLIGRRPLQGPKTFLKQRTIPTMREGVERFKKEPKTWNLVDIDLYKMQEIAKFILGQQTLIDNKQHGTWVFQTALKKAPEGLVPIVDPIGQVWAPPEVTVKEAYDKLLMEGLENFINTLGVKYDRSFQGRGNKWGTSNSRTGDIWAKPGGPEGVIMHEIGHTLDLQYGLWDRIVQPAPRETYTFTKGKRKGQTVTRAARQDATTRKRRADTLRELRKLADLRYEGQENVKESFKDYARERPEQMANLVHAYLYAPERAKQVAPLAYKALDDLIQETPALEALGDLQQMRSLVLGTREAQMKIAGPILLGRYYAPPEVARIFKNYLTPGLSANKVWALLRIPANALVQAKLALSAFHAFTITQESAAMEAARGITDVLRGRPAKGATRLGAALGEPVNVVRRGLAVKKDYLGTLDPLTQSALSAMNLLMAGGGRVEQSREYSNQSIRKFTDALRRANGAFIRGQKGRVGAESLEAALHALPALVEALAYPIMQQLVPAAKDGSTVSQIRSDLETLPGTPTEETLLAIASKAVNLADATLGEVIWDNYFMPRALMSAVHMVIMAPGWRGGSAILLARGMTDPIRRLFPSQRETYRSTTGGGGEPPDPDIDPETGQPIPPKPPNVVESKESYWSPYTSLAIATVLVQVLVSELYQLAHGASHVRNIKDVAFPRTGELDSQGKPERVRLPGYAGIFYDILRDVPSSILEYALGGTAPMPTMVGQLYRNETTFGDEIVAKEDPWRVQLSDYAKFLKEQFEPISVTSFGRRSGTTAEKAESVAGISPAPARVTRSAVETYLHDIQGPPHRNKQQIVASDERRGLREAERAGTALPSAEHLSPQSVKATLRTASKSALEASLDHVTYEQALHALELAEPDERLTILDAVDQKFAGALARTPTKEESAFYARYRAAAQASKKAVGQ